MRIGWAAAGMAVFMLSGCLKPDTVDAGDAWIRLPAVAGRPASGYFALHGGQAPTALVAVSADLAIRTEMHASMKGAGGAMTMTALSRVALPAGTTVTFAPGGRHLMLFGLSPALKPGVSTILTLSFADGSRIQRKAWAVGAGDPAPE